jgi:hypothetical protein
MSMPTTPLLPSLAALALATAASPAPAQDPPPFEVPVVLEERTGLDQPAWPVVLGVPFPEGMLPSVPELALDTPTGTLLADGQVLSRWEDGSVRWLRVGFTAPALAAGERFEAALVARDRGDEAEGILDVSLAPMTAARVDTGFLALTEATGAHELFELVSGDAGLLSAPARAVVETADGVLQPVGAAWMEVEQQSELAVTLRREETLAASDGVPCATLTTRVTLHRGSGRIRLQQSLDITRGVHSLRSWRLELPVERPGLRTHAPLPDGRIARRRGDASIQQTAVGVFDFQGREQAGDFPGVIATANLTVGLRHFAELMPTRAARRGNDLVLDFCPGTIDSAEVVEDGFGRTVELWIDAAPPRAAALHALAGRLEQPARPHCTPQWYVTAGAFGELGLAEAGDHADLEEMLAQSTDEVLGRRSRSSSFHHGIQHFGDFFDGEHSLAYSGALQLEYDPAVVLLQQFLRTGDVDYLDPALDQVWHLADVDSTPHGGVFQHRSTKHHVDAWIGGILGADFRAEWAASPNHDGSLANALDWVAGQYGRGASATLEGWLDAERRRGLPEQDLLGRMFDMIGFHLVERIGLDLAASGLSADTLEAYARQIASLPEASSRGFDDADADFAGFFARYGGSWQDMPSFHVDNAPIPDQRHQAGHSVVQSVALAHLLTGEARLRERALAFGRHQVDEVVPLALRAIEEQRDRTNETLYTRNLGWPLVNLDTLTDLSCGMPAEQALRADMLATMDQCADVLLATPVDRIRSSIHAGLQLEGLARYHQRTGRGDVQLHLRDLARQWATQQYDWNEHAFRYRAHGATEAYPGMSGLVLYGLAYAESLEHDADLWAVVQDAWAHLPQKTGYAKAFGMLYRGAPRTLALMRELRAVRP